MTYIQNDVVLTWAEYKIRKQFQELSEKGFVEFVKKTDGTISWDLTDKGKEFLNKIKL